MTDLDIETEAYASRYFSVIEKGRNPALDEFDTNEVDEALERWADEDGDMLSAYGSKNDPNSWEEVSLE
ncbi:MAG: hypothetical protein JEZ11_24540 [Desulfobacterales bacterium]|nr:hypothetical protein [Desulfobacterales bacterium]